MKCLFTNIQKRYNILENSQIFNFQFWNFQICISVPLTRFNCNLISAKSELQFRRKKFLILVKIVISQRQGHLLFLKLVSAIFYKIFISHEMIALQKLWKMLFISSKKFFLFSRYWIFCISTFPSFSPCQPLP